MALTTEQQEMLDAQAAQTAQQYANMVAIENQRARLDSVRLAKEVLADNNSNKPVSERGITAAEVVAFATTLTAYVNGN